MKTQEMIKELLENPEKEFEAGKTGYTAKMTEGELVVYDRLSRLDYVYLNMEWQEIRKPLSFTEVLERVKENSCLKISFEYDNSDTSYTSMTLDNLITDIGRNLSSSFVATLLLKGKFYIE